MRFVPVCFAAALARKLGRMRSDGIFSQALVIAARKRKQACALRKRLRLMRGRKMTGGGAGPTQPVAHATRILFIL